MQLASFNLDSTSKILLIVAFIVATAVNQITLAKNVRSLPPIIQLVLDDTTHLERVLALYKKPQANHIFIAAHRGGKDNDLADQAPGNSIANIDVAVNKGYDLYESDIEILGDGTLIVFHDDDFNSLTNSTVPNDNLDDADWEYAKNLFLTYSDNSVSNQRIPTLEQFLLALKGKIMAKFDLKSGTFGTSTLIEIMQLVQSTETTEQVLIRGGDNLLTIAAANGFDTRMIMRRYNTAPTVTDIEDLIAGPPVRAISIPDGANADVIAAANAGGLVVEVHESQGVSDAQRELDWQSAIDDGFRQIHSFRPTLLRNYLKANGYRAF